MNEWNWLDFDPQPIKLKKGQHLFEQGAPVTQMYLVRRGRIKLIRYTRDGEVVVLHVATADELMAEASFFSASYHCSAIADLAAEVLAIHREKALSQILGNADTSLQVMQIFARQIRELRGLHEIRHIRSAEARLLAYLHTQANADGRVKLGMSLRDMAYKLGLAHETLYRSLRQLEDDGKLKRPNPHQIELQ